MERDVEVFITLLEDLGLSHAEALTYTALLQLESVSIRKVAAATGINRGTTYEALKRLASLGLASVRRTGDKREQYDAESPERIYELIRDRRRDLVDIADAAKSVIPHIVASKAAAQGRPLVRYYEHDAGIATILKDVLQTCRDLDHPQYYAYSSPTVSQYLYREYPQFTERRIAEDIHVKVVGVGEGGQVAEKSARKWLPNAPPSGVSSYTIIYGNKVATMSIANNETPYGVVVEDAGAANMQRLLFEQLWNTL